MEKKKKQKSILSRLMVYSGNKKLVLYLAMLFSAISGVLLILPAIYIYRIIKSLIFINSISYEMIKINVFYAIIFSISGVLFYILSNIASHIFAFEVENNIIKYNVAKLFNKPLGYFANKESGKIRNIIISGAQETHNILAHQLPDFASTLISPIVIVVLLFVFDWKLGLVSSIPMILGFIIMSTMMTKEAKENTKKYFENIQTLSAETVEYVRGIPVVKAFGQSIESFRRIYNSIIDSRDFIIKVAMTYKNKMSLFEALSSSVAFFLIPISIIIISNGGDVKKTVVNTIIYLLISPVLSILVYRSGIIMNMLYIAQGSLDRIEHTIDSPEMIFGNIDNLSGEIEFKNVTFAYEKSNVLDNISFKIKDGETLALVGRSGGGKSTIAKLLTRFYDANEGEILIGGHNIKDYDQKTLMKNIAFVFQNSKLFKKSLRENLLIAKEDATDEELFEALKNAGAMDIIERLNDSLDTLYGSKGTYFSGGEMQRLVIARAFLKGAKYVILDEATAFADPENEHIIKESFKRLSKGKTTLLIAHRLSSVVGVDRILVIDEGKIVEEGNHNTLLTKNGVYKQMWDEYQRTIDWKIGG